MLVVAVVGSRKSGKTTLIERLVRDLSGEGCRVAVAKHIHHADFDVDVEGKDTWRAFRAGAQAVVGASSSKLFLVARREREDVKEAVRLLEETSKPDLVLLEGFSGTLDRLSGSVYVVVTGSRRPSGGVVIGEYRLGDERSYRDVLGRIRELACSPKRGGADRSKKRQS